MSWNPHLTVAAVICNSQGQHLLVEEAPEGHTVYNQPAGHLEDGESLMDAVIREVHEETCREFTPEHLLGIYHWVAPNGETYMRFCFVGQVGERLADCQLDPDIQDTSWVLPSTLENHPGQTRSPLVMQCIQDYNAGKRYSLETINDLR